MGKQREYPEKKEHDLRPKESEIIRELLSQRRLTSKEVSRKVGCSWSQVCGVKAAMTKGL